MSQSNSSLKITSLEQMQEMAHNGTLVGVFEVPKKLYHAGPGVSCSGLKDVLNSPFYYKWIRENKSRRFSKMTKAMRIGEAGHCAILEPSIFNDHVIVAGKNGHAKAYQEAKKMVEEEDLDITVITQEEHQIVKDAKDFLNSRSLARKLLSGYHEYAFYWIDEETGLLCKCRPDSLHWTGIMGDLKFTGASDEDEFMKIAYDFKYHVQNAFYMEGVHEALKQSGQTIAGLELPTRFFFVAILLDDPLDWIPLELPEEFREEGRKEFRRALRMLKRAIDEDYWPRKNEFYNEDKGKWEDRVKMARVKAYMFRRD